jgi:hypothetical protein
MTVATFLIIVLITLSGGIPSCRSIAAAGRESLSEYGSAVTWHDHGRFGRWATTLASPSVDAPSLTRAVRCLIAIVPMHQPRSAFDEVR